jgi:hypothetical protein
MDLMPILGHWDIVKNAHLGTLGYCKIIIGMGWRNIRL